MTVKNYKKKFVKFKKNKKDKEPTNEKYKDTIKLFEEWGKEKTQKYLKKYKFEEGFEYKKLIEEIEKKIKETIKEEDVMKITFTRYKIFDLLTINSFGENKMLEREKEYKKIEKEITDNKINKSNKIEMMKLLLKNNYDDIEHLKEEIENINLNENEIESYIELLNYLHKIYKEKKEDIIKEYYNELCKKLCENIVIKINGLTKNKTNEHKSNIAKSLAYYYAHKIEHKINMEDSAFNNDEKKN